MKRLPAVEKGWATLKVPEIEEKLKLLPGWEVNKYYSYISKIWKFKKFEDALAFVNRAAELAEDAHHHPDFSFGWNYVKLSFTTYSIGGLHENDFIMAHECDKLSQNNT